MPRLEPTAQALAAEVAATPNRSLLPVPALGLGWMAQARPFRCSMSVGAQSVESKLTEL
jgi:hypothetical protein